MFAKCRGSISIEVEVAESAGKLLGEQSQHRHWRGFIGAQCAARLA
jgi:hypothetical protein